jgi:aryl-alcohol dehydrogenase-like predicted oxidoreductase
MLNDNWYFLKHGPEDFPDDDFRKNLPKFSKENFPTILKIADGLKDIGKAYGATAAQVAIAWLVAQGVIPIPGAKQLKYVEENLAAGKLKLSEDDLKKIRILADECDKNSKGDRYPSSYVGQLLADTPALDA